jgi:hypothetical protein
MMNKKTADIRQKLARVDFCVTILAFLWLATSALLFLVVAPRHLHAQTHHAPLVQHARIQPAQIQAHAHSLRM